MEMIIESEGELEEVVRRLLEYAKGRRKFALYGEIGAGKTTFVQAFCRHFGLREPVTSPTFALANEYAGRETADDDWVTIHHLDLYRLRAPEEALDIGIEEYLFDEHYCLIEWPGLIESLLPEDVIRIRFEIIEDSSRKILFL